MSATLSVKDRPAFTDGSLDGGTPEEKAHAYETITCYSGGFDVDEDTHVVTQPRPLRHLPQLVGRDLERNCIFEGDTLKLAPRRCFTAARTWPATSSGSE